MTAAMALHAVLAAAGWLLAALLILVLSRVTPDLRDVGQPDKGGEW